MDCPFSSLLTPCIYYVLDIWLGLLTVNTITSVFMITLNVKTHISVKINIFEHLNCACRTSYNTPSYIHVLARKHVFNINTVTSTQ